MEPDYTRSGAQAVSWEVIVLKMSARSLVGARYNPAGCLYIQKSQLQGHYTIRDDFIVFLQSGHQSRPNVEHSPFSYD